MRDCEIEDFGQDTESLYYSALAAAKILGIDFDDKGKRSEPDIRWSGFSSQGDGASFVGSYSHSPNSPARIRSEFPTDTALHAIADGLEQRKRYQDEKITGGLSDIRGIFLSKKMKIKRKYKAYKVARRLLGRA
jgi:hypothetical protein